ncbi:hypothetical protein llap_12452 [Limosa lapponica baueri]|uniref:Uncharacterized protein n=1 Tax=Limosa lapponica baueri TaxID=1758121 RepID=A0A2I0TU25_LIMLA|nr:hypothetical protein llap_12452 [Limosa lapponica baueri]
MPCGKCSGFPAGSASIECPPGEAGVKGDGRDEGQNCQLNASSESWDKVEFSSIQSADNTETGKHKDLGFSEFMDDAALLCEASETCSKYHDYFIKAVERFPPLLVLKAGVDRNTSAKNSELIFSWKATDQCDAAQDFGEPFLLKKRMK